MSVESIIQSIKNLVKVHENLLKISEEKTEVVKAGSVDKLQTVLIKERKLVQLLDKEEDSRKKKVDEWFLQNGFPTEDTTISKILESLTNEKEKKELENHTVELTELMLKLKQQEQLNLALIQQSMQFVQVSLDLMSPSLKNMNYGNEKDQSSSNRSMFDSRA
ncbi:FlgN protein [Oceanobacillus limi]|uniref:FlgN protein n=1 Tax=Oceanobacillus limi TaxID=930131 RepID=A0A1I0BQZ3_9BACI|nr:flagellar protein FlgN [Oceanobacillus limi]SET09450.1 FlgN protein [Oceanobacillus limi]